MTKYRELTDLPPRLFAVGDLHGCPAELDHLLEYLRKSKSLTDADMIVFIGDYIDRGPDAKGVIERLIALQTSHPNVSFLKGNHEDMLLSYLGFPGNMGQAYLVNGGAETLKSYQIAPLTMPEEVASRIPSSHLGFLLNLESYIIAGDYILVHAGLSPLRDLRSQLDEDLFWIRDEFIHNRHNFEKVVVFGHTPYQDVMCHLPYKIGIDTGLVYGNKLTCVELMSQTVLQIERGSSTVIERPLPPSVA